MRVVIAKGMAVAKDMTGYKVGMCEVLERADSDKNGKAQWLVKCECGNQFVTRGNSIRVGHVKSCGCTRDVWAKKMGQNNKTHGDTKSRLYKTWKGMRDRCNKEYHKSYPQYGGRGITVFKGWDESFENFKEWALTNGYTDELTIDRKSNDEGYHPDNCRWVDLKTQGRNRRNNVRDFYKGEYRTLSEIAEIIGESRSFVRYRYKNGIDYDKPKRRIKQADL